MKKLHRFALAIILFGLAGGALLYVGSLISGRAITIDRIDARGVHVGDAHGGSRTESDVWGDAGSPVTKNIYYVSGYLREGDRHFLDGDYERAADAYRKAYIGSLGELSVLPPGQSFAGRRLLETYEKLERYDDALALLTEMQSKGSFSSDVGVQKATAIRNRLLSAKASHKPLNRTTSEGIRLNRTTSEGIR